MAVVRRLEPSVETIDKPRLITDAAFETLGNDQAMFSICSFI